MYGRNKIQSERRLRVIVTFIRGHGIEIRRLAISSAFQHSFRESGKRASSQ